MDFSVKKKRMLWPSSGNLRFCMPSKELCTRLPVKPTGGEADLFYTDAQRAGLIGQKHGHAAARNTQLGGAHSANSALNFNHVSN